MPQMRRSKARDSKDYTNRKFIVKENSTEKVPFMVSRDRHTYRIRYESRMDPTTHNSSITWRICTDDRVRALLELLNPPTSDTEKNLTSNMEAPLCLEEVKSIMLQGMLLNVFVKKDHLPHTLHIESELTRTGFAGLWGNKGGVSIRLDIGGINLCFVNCHLAPHQDEVSSRIEDFSAIVNDQKFKDEDVDNILDHDYVFWLGDMNFRIDNMERETILKHIADQKYDAMQTNDQLLQVKKEELAFIDFEEGKLDFAPTYKFDVGTDIYDTSHRKRLPAWCDRVLWMIHEDAFHDITLEAKLLKYTSVPSYMDSDHKPVIAVFDILVFNKLPKPADVTFEPIKPWRTAKDITFSYTVAKDVETSTSDWIGLYKEDTFPDFDAYTEYIYAETSTDQPITQSFSLSQLSGKSGKYRLCYFNSNSSVLGSSDAFTIEIGAVSKPFCCAMF